MADQFLVKQGMVGDNFVHRPGDVIEWPAANEIPALLEAGILEVYEVAAPAKPETPETTKSKKRETR